MSRRLVVPQCLEALPPRPNSGQTPEFGWGRIFDEISARRRSISCLSDSRQFYDLANSVGFSDLVKWYLVKWVKWVLVKWEGTPPCRAAVSAGPRQRPHGQTDKQLDKQLVKQLVIRGPSAAPARPDWGPKFG